MRGGGDAIDGGEEGGAVGIAISLASYKRDADYAFAARFAADLAIAAVARVPGFIDAMRGNVLNVNVPAIPAGAIKGVKRTVPGKSCTQPDWIRVPPPAAADADYTSEGEKRVVLLSRASTTTRPTEPPTTTPRRGGGSRASGGSGTCPGRPRAIARRGPTGARWTTGTSASRRWGPGSRRSATSGRGRTRSRDEVETKRARRRSGTCWRRRGARARGARGARGVETRGGGAGEPSLAPGRGGERANGGGRGRSSDRARERRAIARTRTEMKRIPPNRAEGARGGVSRLVHIDAPRDVLLDETRKRY